jgi:RND family efflux transporter MFP subunit
MKLPTEILDPYATSPDQATEEAIKATRFSRGTGWRILIVFALIVVALGAGYLFVSHEKAATEGRLADATRQDAAEPPTVDAVTVGLSPATQTLALPGETAAWDEATIYARVNGYVAKWFVDIGDVVKVGQTLATIDTPELDAELLAAKAKLNASVAQVAVKQARADFARTTAERWLDSPKGAVSDQEREDKKAGSAEATAELSAARAQVALDQANVDRLNALTQFKTVQAPFNGTIVQRQIDTGNLVTAGSGANTSPLYRVVQDDLMRVFVHAPQSAADQLMEPGATASISFGGQSDKRFEGKVTRTAKAIDPQSRTLRVEIDVPNPDHTLVPGMYVQVNFKLTGGVRIQVPAAALLFRSGGPQVAVIDEKGAVAFRPVTIVRDDGAVVSIGSGLAAGDKVALNLGSQITPGEIVKTNPVDNGDTKSASSAQ